MYANWGRATVPADSLVVKLIDSAIYARSSIREVADTRLRVCPHCDIGTLSYKRHEGRGCIVQA